MDLMFGVHQRLMVTSSLCSNGIFIRKISSFMKLRIIAVPVGNEIKKFPNDTCHFFFSTRVAILQTVVNYDSFEGKVLILLLIFHLNTGRTSP